jgi:hypothetical protein
MKRGHEEGPERTSGRLSAPDVVESMDVVYGLLVDERVVRT